MSEVITAVYEKGVLRPLHPLNLREKEIVRLQVLPPEPVDEAEEVIQLLVAAGLMTPPRRALLHPTLYLKKNVVNWPRFWVKPPGSPFQKL